MAPVSGEHLTSVTRRWVVPVVWAVAGTVLVAAGRFEFESYTEVAKLFEESVYTQETWQAGIRVLARPRMFVRSSNTRLTSKCWGAKTCCGCSRANARLTGVTSPTPDPREA